MADKGIAKVQYIGSAGQVMPQGAGVGDWDFIYSVSTVKDRARNIGDRVVLPDGRAFRYSKSGAICQAGRGNIIYNKIGVVGVDYAILPVGAVVGARQVTLTAVVAQTEDVLRGGIIALKQTNAADDATLQWRGIVGNTAVTAAQIAAGSPYDRVTVYLDAPVSIVLTTLSYAFCMPSPYSDIRYTDNESLSDSCSMGGMAATYVNAANKYFWLQTWGLCVFNHQGECGTTAHGRGLVWRYDGSVQHSDPASPIGGEFQQIAGYIMDNTGGDTGATFDFMTVNP